MAGMAGSLVARRAVHGVAIVTILDELRMCSLDARARTKAITKCSDSFIKIVGNPTLL